jgi:hypothetical protein
MVMETRGDERIESEGLESDSWEERTGSDGTMRGWMRLSGNNTRKGKRERKRKREKRRLDQIRSD